MILHKDFIFAHLTKTGGTFIRHYLSEFIPGTFRKCGGRKIGKHDALYVLPKSILDTCYKFGSIRNPLSFYISLWGANITPEAINNRPRRKIWFKERPEMKKDPKKFIKHLCEGERGRIKFFNFDLMKQMDIGVLTYRYLHLYFDHTIFNDINWQKNYEKYKLVDEVIRLEDNLKKQLIRVFRRNIFPLSKRQRKELKNLPKKNTSAHKPFMEYYDQDTIDYVKHKERFIFKLHYGGEE